MKDNIKFSLVIDKLNQKIAELNIKLARNENDPVMKAELDEILKDKDLLYHGSDEELKAILDKYGDLVNEWFKRTN